MAARNAKLLLGCYRIGDANDPEVYTAAAIAVLARYGEDIQQMVVDPVHGLPGRVKWLPTISELKDACEELIPRRTWGEAWDARARLQLEQRAQLEHHAQEESPEHRAKVVERIRAEMAAVGMPMPRA